VTRRVTSVAWISGLLALFLVAVLPACLFGAKLQAVATSTPVTPATPGDEERDDGALRKDSVVAPPSLCQTARARRATARIGVDATERSRAAARSVVRTAPRWIPRAVFSVRRLI
jgi:hypothetical protein